MIQTIDIYLQEQKTHQFDIVVGVDRKMGIAKDKIIPWHADDNIRKEDMSVFRKITQYGEKRPLLIVGYRTFNDFSDQTLQSITNSRDLHVYTPSATFVNFSELLQRNLGKNVYIIGGAKTYEYFLDKKGLRYIYMCVIDRDYDCDLHFPEIPNTMQFVNSFPISKDISVRVYKNAFEKTL